MKIGLHSRFCDNCKKNVVDFTNKDRRQILEYLLNNYDKKVCGHIYPSQLDFSYSDFLVTIRTLSNQANNRNLPFYLLTMGTLILAGCSNNQQTTGSSVVDTTFINTNTSQDTTAAKTDTTIGTTVKEPIKIPEIAIDGEIMVGTNNTFGHAEPYMFVDTMPEFKGGVDSLMNFITKNLKYPEWEKKNKIQGKVFVSFVIDKNGKIKDAKILRTVLASKNFDSEVLRVVNRMPDWTPGRQEGNSVDVKFNLPINFTL